MVDSRDERKTFHDFHLSDQLLKALDAIGYVSPTPVQAASIPLIMAGIDLIVQSQTGTGKTAAFGIPLVEVLEPDPGRIEVLVLTPTRELAKQVCDEFERLSAHRPVSATAIYGGASYGPQIAGLKSAQIVCATPGRLLDLLKQKELTLDHLRFFILDEADEMLSMGFERDLRAILEYLPQERQSLLFSATVTSEVRALSKNMLFHPEFLSFSSESLVNRDVTHEYYRLGGIARARDLIKVLELEEPDNAIIFANTKDDTFLVTSFLQRHGYRAEVLNGDLPQVERERTLLKLREGVINYLVATDVAARGIDISDLSHVINYVLPDSPETYVHRTGRTGRAGKKGKAISLLSPAEMGAFIQIRKRVDASLQERILPTTREIVAAKRARRQRTLIDRVERQTALPSAPYLSLAAELWASLQGDDAARAHNLLASLLAVADHSLDAQGALKLSAAPATAPAPAPIQAAAPKAAPVVEPIAAPAAAPAPKEATTRVEAAPAPKPIIKQEEGDALEPELLEALPAEVFLLNDVEPLPLLGLDDEDLEPAPQAAAPSPGPARHERRHERGDRRDRRRGRGSRDEDRRSARDSQRSSPLAAPPVALPKPAPLVIEHGMSKMWISAGQNIFKQTQDLLTFLVYNSGMDAEDFGEVELGRGQTVVEVRQDYIQDVIAAIHELEHQGTTLAAGLLRK